MKTIRALTFALFVSLRAFGAEPSLEFRGVMVGGGPTKLSLVDKATDTTRWIEVGKTFAGFTIKAYDVPTETATLTKDGKEVRIRLNTSRIIEAPTAASAPAGPNTGKISIATARTIYNNLRQISAAFDQYCLENNKSSATLDTLVGPTKYIKQLKSEAGEDYSGLKLAADYGFLSVTTSSGEPIVWDFNGKKSTFYTVRAGQSLAQVAEATGSTVSQLVELNGDMNPATLRVGESLRTK